MLCLFSEPGYSKQGVAHTCHPSTVAMEAGGQEFKASLGYIGSWRPTWAT